MKHCVILILLIICYSSLKAQIIPSGSMDITEQTLYNWDTNGIITATPSQRVSGFVRVRTLQKDLQKVTYMDLNCSAISPYTLQFRIKTAELLLRDDGLIVFAVTVSNVVDESEEDGNCRVVYDKNGKIIMLQWIFDSGLMQYLNLPI